MRVNSLLVWWVGVEFVLFLVGCRLVDEHEVIELNPIQYCEKHSRLSLSFICMDLKEYVAMGGIVL